MPRTDLKLVRGIFFRSPNMIMNNTDPKEKRVFERIPVEIPLKVTYLDSNKETLARTCDISASGIGLITHEQLPLSSLLEIWLEIPDNGKPLHTTGEVAWSKQVSSEAYRVGISLEKVELMGMSRILRVIQ